MVRDTLAVSATSVSSQPPTCCWSPNSWFPKGSSKLQAGRSPGRRNCLGAAFPPGGCMCCLSTSAVCRTQRGDQASNPRRLLPSTTASGVGQGARQKDLCARSRRHLTCLGDRDKSYHLQASSPDDPAPDRAVIDDPPKKRSIRTSPASQNRRPLTSRDSSKVPNHSGIGAERDVGPGGESRQSSAPPCRLAAGRPTSVCWRSPPLWAASPTAPAAGCPGDCPRSPR